MIIDRNALKDASEWDKSFIAEILLFAIIPYFINIVFKNQYAGESVILSTFSPSRNFVCDFVLYIFFFVCAKSGAD